MLVFNHRWLHNNPQLLLPILPVQLSIQAQISQKLHQVNFFGQKKGKKGKKREFFSLVFWLKQKLKNTALIAFL